MAQWLNGLLRKVEAVTLYIDMGANLGIHGLHAAMAATNMTENCSAEDFKKVLYLMRKIVSYCTNNKMEQITNELNLLSVIVS